MKNHVQDIINYGKSRGLTLFNANGAVVFSGGGSIILKHIIKELYPSAIIIDDAQFANVLSFLTILRSNVKSGKISVSFSKTTKMYMNF